MKITIPTNRNWQVSYFGDLFSNIVDAFNVDLHYSEGKIRTGQYLYPHTVTDDIAGIGLPTSFILSNAGNGSATPQYWAACEKLYKQNVTGVTSISTAIFAADALTNSPTGLTDSDLCNFGVTAGSTNTSLNGIDILVCSTNTDLSVLNRLDGPGAYAWQNKWWSSDLVDTFSATTTGAPVQITVASTANYNSGDQIEISGTAGFIGTDNLPHSLDGIYTITVIDGTHINLNGGNAYGEILTGSITRIHNNLTGYNFLGQTALIAGVPHILLPFGNGPELFVTDDYQVHSIGTPGDLATNTAPTDVQYGRLIFRQGYSCNWACATSLKIYFGLKCKRGDNYPSLVEEYDPFNEQVRETKVYNGTTIGFINGNTLNIIDIKGNLKAYNGSDFDVFAQFPAAEYDGFSFALPHRNGISTSESRINFLVNSGSDQYDGWWVYEIDAKRLYHQGSPVPSKVSQFSFGSVQADSFGAIFPIQNLFGGWLAGVATCKNQSTSQTGIFTSPNIGLSVSYNPIGRVTLGKIPSSDIDSVYRNLLIKYNPVLDRLGLQQGTIVVKYKMQEYPFNGFSLNGTWINATSFSSSQTARIVVGAEMVVTQGNAAGASFTVLGIAGTTVTISDESLGFVPAGTFAFNMDNFLAFPTESYLSDNTKNYGLVDIPDTFNEWCQFRIEIRGTGGYVGFSLEEVQLGVQPNLKVEPDYGPLSTRGLT
jgi:hypothetical protein